MKKYFYDLHIHSCLSPCGDDESTPNSIAGIGELNSLDIMALCDHNSCKNCPAFFEACLRHGVLPVAGMELTTAEDIHMICLFPDLERAMEFDRAVYGRLMKIKNREDIFGKQLICDSEDNILGSEEFLLSNATDISVEEAPALAESFGGICYPAHIDRDANGIISVLGTLPEKPSFSCVELRDGARLEEYSQSYGLEQKKVVINSDAHYLWDIKEQSDFILMDEISDPKRAGETLIKYLRDGK